MSLLVSKFREVCNEKLDNGEKTRQLRGAKLLVKGAEHLSRRTCCFLSVASINHVSIRATRLKEAARFG